MTNSQRLATVRERLCRWLAQQSTDEPGDAKPAAIECESLLVIDGFYCGRRFHAGSCVATWFIEEDELKIHDDHGNLLCVFDSAEIDHVTAPRGRQESSGVRDLIVMRPVEQPTHVTNEKDDQNEIRRAA